MTAVSQKSYIPYQFQQTMDIRSFFKGRRPVAKPAPPKPVAKPAPAPKPLTVLEERWKNQTFECPRCLCVLHGEDANERRMWVTTDPNEMDPNEGYDVCDNCEEAAQAEEKAKWR